jgi:hypothetical protein
VVFPSPRRGNVRLRKSLLEITAEPHTRDRRAGYPAISETYSAIADPP